MDVNSSSEQAFFQKRTRIKVCGFTREQDIDTAVAAGVDAVGFVLYAPSPRAVSVQRAATLAQRLPAFVTPVLLFVNADDALLQEAKESVPHAVWQFHGDETPQRCNAVTQNGARAYMRAARMPIAKNTVKGEAASGFDLVKFAQQYANAQAILLDALVDGYGGGGKVFDWTQLPQNIDAHLVLSGGLTPDNVGQGIAQLRGRCQSLAVDVSSGVESAKGIKDAAKIQAFVAAVRAEDQG